MAAVTVLDLFLFFPPIPSFSYLYNPPCFHLFSSPLLSPSPLNPLLRVYSHSYVVTTHPPQA